MSRILIILLLVLVFIILITDARRNHQKTENRKSRVMLFKRSKPWKSHINKNTKQTLIQKGRARRQRLQALRKKKQLQKQKKKQELKAKQHRRQKKRQELLKKKQTQRKQKRQRIQALVKKKQLQKQKKKQELKAKQHRRQKKRQEILKKKQTQREQKRQSLQALRKQKLFQKQKKKQELKNKQRKRQELVKKARQKQQQQRRQKLINFHRKLNKQKSVTKWRRPKTQKRNYGCTKLPTHPPTQNSSLYIDVESLQRLRYIIESHGYKEEFPQLFATDLLTDFVNSTRTHEEDLNNTTKEKNVNGDISKISNETKNEKENDDDEIKFEDSEETDGRGTDDLEGGESDRERNVKSGLNDLVKNDEDGENDGVMNMGEKIDVNKTFVHQGKEEVTNRDEHRVAKNDRRIIDEKENDEKISESLDGDKNVDDYGRREIQENFDGRSGNEFNEDKYLGHRREEENNNSSDLRKGEKINDSEISAKKERLIESQTEVDINQKYEKNENDFRDSNDEDKQVYRHDDNSVKNNTYERTHKYDEQTDYSTEPTTVLS